ncbi:hypothetical protein Misp01_67980 [Microtetraspora sp. NBRC 13810]|nr:hypothetical protein Misp01_67980 [Microtetraspora sp. NBRC 13810]
MACQPNSRRAREGSSGAERVRTAATGTLQLLKVVGVQRMAHPNDAGTPAAGGVAGSGVGVDAVDELGELAVG